MADRNTAGTTGECASSQWGRLLRFSEPLRKFWSRRRQSTSVNGVCQAQTTTSSILDVDGGTKNHNSRKCLCRMTKSRMGGGFERCRASRRAARTDRTVVIKKGDQVPISRGYALGVGGTRCGNGAVSVEGCGRCGQRGGWSWKCTGMYASWSTGEWAFSAFGNRGGDFC